MVCPHCGASVPEGIAVCPVCKSVLGVDVATGRLPAPPDPPPTTRLPGGAPPVPSGYRGPNPYATPPPTGYPPAGQPPAGYSPAPSTPYNPGPPAYPPGPLPGPAGPAPAQRNQTLLWIGVGLLAASLVLFLCVGLVVAFGAPTDSTGPEEVANLRLGGVICAVGILFVLGVPGAILFFLGVRR